VTNSAIVAATFAYERSRRSDLIISIVLRATPIGNAPLG